MENRSPLESIFGIIGSLPQGHDKPVKHALYNSVALLLLVVCCAAAWALFMILEPFIKPLIWALLVGSVLHPLKRTLRDTFQVWFATLETANTPVVLGVAIMPIKIINDISEVIGDLLLKRIKFIISICVVIPMILILYNYTPRIILCLIYKIYVYNTGILGFFLDNANIYLVTTILLGYLTLIGFLWKPQNNTKFHYASIGIWLYISCALAHLFGSFQMLIFILLQVIFFGGFLCEVYGIFQELNASGHAISYVDSLKLAFHDKSIEDDSSSETNKDNIDDKSSDSDLIKDKVEELDDVNPRAELDATGDKLTTPISDPWNMELFSEKKPTDTQKRQLNSPSVLITNQGIHLIPQQSVFSNILKPKKKFLKRSLSQPYCDISKLKERSSLLNFGRKLSLKNYNQSLLEGGTYESTYYIYSVLWACIVVLFWKNIVLLPLLPLPILYYVIKHVGRYFGIWNLLYIHVSKCLSLVAHWCQERQDAFVPMPIRGLFRFIHSTNNFIEAAIKDSIDTVCSCAVIFGLIIFVACASIFIVFQIYAETIMMAQMISNVINQTVVHNPELRQLLPPTFDDTMDSILDNAYQYGREGISKAVQSMMSGVDTSKSEKLEKQVLDLWDRLYQSWMATENSDGPQVTQDAVRASWDSFLSDIQKSPEIFNLNGLMDFAKQNVGTLMSLLESVWSIVKGNIGLLLGSFSAFLSLILGGGTAVLNFILNGVVFLTTLFYLLSSSGDLYKPVELLTNFSPSGRRFGHALEGAVNGVFTASFKMAVFYGLWTWFIHNLFGVKIVYLPSAFATILEAVPFLGTYWACIPAVLDLWLAQDRGIAATIFAVFQFLPTSIVDTTIYKEIKGGGHPYLTGLAVAGGIFCLGVEGAIIGPLLLCGLYVVIDLSSSFFRESPSEEQPINLRLKLQDR